MKKSLGSMRWLALVAGFFFIADSVVAQQYLTVRNQNRPKRFRFDYGDFIGVKIKDSRKVYKGEIYNLTDSTIYLAGPTTMHKINLDEIRVLKDYRWNKFTGAIARSALYTIPFFLLAETFTGSSPPEGESGLVYKPGYLLSIVYAGVVAVLYPIKGRRYKMGRRWKVMVINPYPD